MEWKDIVGKTVESVEDYIPLSLMDEDSIKITFTDGIKCVVGIWTPHGNGMLVIKESEE